MRRKHWAILFMMIFILTACAPPAVHVGESSGTIVGAEKSKQKEAKKVKEGRPKEGRPKEGRPKEGRPKEGLITEQDTGRESVSSNRDGTMDVQNEVYARQDDLRAQELYEIFVNQEYAGVEDYAYVTYDADGDGCRELYMKRGSLGSFYVISFVNGGLRIEYQKEIPSEVNGLQWVDTETLPETQDGEMVHSGIYVYAEQGNKSESFWYPNESDFVAAEGFGGMEPFFVCFLPDGSKRLALYYDEAMQRGCGIRYYERDPSTFTTTGMYGFAFEGLQERKENGIRKDYLKPEIYDGSKVMDYVDDFAENREYDEKGRPIHYVASGTFSRERATVFEPVLQIDYEYYDNGSLKSRFYWHASLLFGSTYTTWNCYFDEQGRIMYEDSYITHGSYDTYYIYMDDTEEPAYILTLDNCVGEWIPEFWKHGSQYE